MCHFRNEMPGSFGPCSMRYERTLARLLAMTACHIERLRPALAYEPWRSRR
jgi:hypothetical protein